jgi:serine/threonine protein kinase
MVQPRAPRLVRRVGIYELGKTLGTGTFGKVKYAIDVTDPMRTAYAIKILDRQHIEKEGMVEQLHQEIAIMRMLKHGNIVKLFQVMQSSQHIYMVLELVTGGELFDRIIEKKRFDETVARRYFQQLVFGMNYCHQRGVAHRDLKPENLLLDAQDCLRISDFGLSAIGAKDGRPKLLTTTCGTPNYVAPEVLSEKGYNGMHADVWSAAVILFVMMAGFLPFEDATTGGLFAKIEKGKYRMPRFFSTAAKILISQLLVVDPAKRLTACGIMQDTWFQIGVEPSVLRVNMNYVGEKIASTPEPQLLAVEETDRAHSDSGQFHHQELTAFELASKLVMGSLSPLISPEINLRRNAQFVASAEAGEAREKTTAVLEQLGAKPSRGKSNNVKGYLNVPVKGLVMFNFSFLPTVCPELTLVEVRRVRGDTLAFQTFYRDVVTSLKDIVPCQPSSDDDAEDDYDAM